jgi:hypothetical protein
MRRSTFVALPMIAQFSTASERPTSAPQGRRGVRAQSTWLQSEMPINGQTDARETRWCGTPGLLEGVSFDIDTLSSRRTYFFIAFATSPGA